MNNVNKIGQQRVEIFFEIDNKFSKGIWYKIYNQIQLKVNNSNWGQYLNQVICQIIIT